MTKNLWYFRAPVIRILYIEGEQYMTDNQTSDLPDDSIIVIFGASGDLTARKLIPAYYDLFVHHRMPRTFAILGVGRTEYRDESFRTRHEQALRDIHGESRAEIDRIRSFLDRIRYHSMQTDAAEAYSGLARRLASLRADLGIDENYLYYLATPPNLYPLIPVLLSDAGLADTARGWKRIIVEKPFGYDGQSARDLDDTLHRHFDESQIFRIDHYLGKETVQNLLVFRFANGMFEPLWNRNHIDYVEITAAESIGVENRGGYYDATGALRDMFQNHLLQVLAIAAMEPPAVISARATRDEILKVLQCLRPLTEADLRDHLVLGQYTASKIGGQPVPRVPRGRPGGRRFPHRDLRFPETVRRQLALERGAFLRPHRQAPADPGHRGGDPFHQHSPPGVLEKRYRQQTDHPDPARRGHPGEIRPEETRSRIRCPGSGDGFPLSGFGGGEGFLRLRTTAPWMLPWGTPHSSPAATRSAPAGSSSNLFCAIAARRNASSTGMPPEPGGRRRPTSFWPPMDGSGAFPARTWPTRRTASFDRGRCMR
jgi:hypothetical protein